MINQPFEPIGVALHLCIIPGTVSLDLHYRLLTQTLFIMPIACGGPGEEALDLAVIRGACVVAPLRFSDERPW